jgi:hemerythrin-like domain-containing protein
MNALTSLIREHQVISRLIDALQVYARRLRLEQNAIPADLAHFARVFREYADEIHHEKEEGILLPILGRNGFHWDQGVLPEVRRDHRQERYLIEVLQQAGARQDAWSNEDKRSIVATALALVEFQREHLELENTRLFSEVPKRLAQPALAQLAHELAGFDAYVQESGRYAHLLELIDDLIARYAQSDEETPSSLSGVWPSAENVVEQSCRGGAGRYAGSSCRSA